MVTSLLMPLLQKEDPFHFLQKRGKLFHFSDNKRDTYKVAMELVDFIQRRVQVQWFQTGSKNDVILTQTEVTNWCDPHSFDSTLGIASGLLKVSLSL